LWGAARDEEEIEIQWKEANEGPPATEEQDWRIETRPSKIECVCSIALFLIL
jgi:hypothetical protein